MKEPSTPQELPIPKSFLSEETGEPINRCIQCDHDLMLGDRYYVIEKVFKKYPKLSRTEVLFEYAICDVCYDKMKEKLSTESMANLSNYMMTNTDFNGIYEKINQSPDDPEGWLTHCMIKGAPIDDLQEYQIGAFFRGDQLVTNYLPPFMIGEMAMEEMNELLSDETKDEMDGFMDEHFGIPPELRRDLILL